MNQHNVCDNGPRYISLLLSSDNGIGSYCLFIMDLPKVKRCAVQFYCISLYFKRSRNLIRIILIFPHAILNISRTAHIGPHPLVYMQSIGQRLFCLHSSICFLLFSLITIENNRFRTPTWTYTTTSPQNNQLTNQAMPLW